MKLPKDDVVFKNLFSSLECKGMLKELLEAILQIKINTIEVNKEVETAQMNVKDKYGRLDLQATINENTTVIIEMQNIDYGNMEKRVVYYAGKVIGSSLEIGQDYNKMKDVIVIAILDYEMLSKNEYYTETVTVDNKYRKYEVIEGVKYYFIELPKFRRMVNKPSNKLEDWLAFIDYERKDVLSMAIKNNKLVKKAQLTYEYLTGDEAKKRIEYLRERAIRDEHAAYNAGERKGKLEAKIETAKAMMQNKIKQELIAKCTGFNNIELNKIEQSMQQVMR